MNNLGLVFLAIAVILGSLAQIFLKIGGGAISKITFNWQGFFTLLKEIFTNHFVTAWVILGGITALCWMLAISRLNLSFVIPLGLSLVIILVALLSRLIIGEQISLLRWLGILVIIAGIFLASR